MTDMLPLNLALVAPGPDPEQQAVRVFLPLVLRLEAGSMSCCVQASTCGWRTGSGPAIEADARRMFGLAHRDNKGLTPGDVHDDRIIGRVPEIHRVDRPRRSRC
jgi:hypothetical protein